MKETDFIRSQREYIEDALSTLNRYPDNESWQNLHTGRLIKAINEALTEAKAIEKKRVNDNTLDPNNPDDYLEIKRQWSYAYQYMLMVAQYHPEPEQQYQAWFNCAWFAARAHLYTNAIEASEKMIASGFLKDSDVKRLQTDLSFQLCIIEVNRK